MVRLNIKRSEIKKVAVTSVIGILLAVFFYRLFSPADIPAALTYAIFFVLIPSYAVYYLVDRIVDRLMPEKKVEVVE